MFMNVVVCIKQVPATTEIEMDEETGTLIREGIEVEINPFDLYAIEEGIRIKEKYGGKVTALTMGPPQAESALRETIAMEVDDAILLSDKAFAGSDTLATSYTLSCAIKKLNCDIIICGVKTTDGDTGQVGPELAEQLGIPHVCYVTKVGEIKSGRIRVKRELGNICEELEAPLPLLITVTKDINEPRLPSFKRKMYAKKVEIKLWKSRDLQENCLFGLDGSPTRVIKTFPPPKQENTKKIIGDSSTQAKKLVSKLIKLKVMSI